MRTRADDTSAVSIYLVRFVAHSVAMMWAANRPLSEALAAAECEGPRREQALAEMRALLERETGFEPRTPLERAYLDALLLGGLAKVVCDSRRSANE